MPDSPTLGKYTLWPSDGEGQSVKATYHFADNRMYAERRKSIDRKTSAISQWVSLKNGYSIQGSSKPSYQLIADEI